MWWRQRRLRLLQEEGHAHLAVHRQRGLEVFVGLRPVARSAVELAEAEVAMGDEGAHAELAGEGQALVVVAFGFLGAAC
jgi:hypothetical protein